MVPYYCSLNYLNKNLGWHAEFHLRGPMKCFYEAVQTTGSVKAKSGFRQKLRSPD